MHYSLSGGLQQVVFSRNVQKVVVSYLSPYNLLSSYLVVVYLNAQFITDEKNKPGKLTGVFSMTILRLSMKTFMMKC